MRRINLKTESNKVNTSIFFLHRLGLKVKRQRNMAKIKKKFSKNNRFQMRRINLKTESNKVNSKNFFKTHVSQSFSFRCDVIPEHIL